MSSCSCHCVAQDPARDSLHRAAFHFRQLSTRKTLVPYLILLQVFTLEFLHFGGDAQLAHVADTFHLLLRVRR